MKILFVFLWVSISSLSFAQVNVQDPLAEPFLNNISLQFTSENALQVIFSFDIYSPTENINITDQGSLIIKDHQYRLETKNTETLYNGKYQWVHNISAGEVYQSEPDEQEENQMLVNPFRLLSDYSRFFKYRFRGTEENEGLTYSVIDLYPENLEGDYSLLRIKCKDQGKSIYSLTIKQKNGTILTAYLKGIQRDIQVSKETFTWDAEANPDILLIEM